MTYAVSRVTLCARLSFFLFGNARFFRWEKKIVKKDGRFGSSLTDEVHHLLFFQWEVQETDLLVVVV